MPVPRFPILLLMAACLGSPLAASAQSSGSFDPARPGLYVGANGLGLYDDFDAELFGLDIEADDGWGLGARLGYRVNRYVALELRAEWFDAVDLDLGPADDIATADTWTASANLKLYPLAGRIQPYVLAGAGVLGADLDAPGIGSVEDEAFAGRFGGGLDLVVTKHVVLDVEGAYYLARSRFDDFSFFTLGAGLQLRF